MEKKLAQCCKKGLIPKVIHEDMDGVLGDDAPLYQIVTDLGSLDVGEQRVNFQKVLLGRKHFISRKMLILCTI